MVAVHHELRIDSRLLDFEFRHVRIRRRHRCLLTARNADRCHNRLGHGCRLFLLFELGIHKLLELGDADVPVRAIIALRHEPLHHLIEGLLTPLLVSEVHRLT